VPRIPVVFDRELDDWYAVSGSDKVIAARLDQALAAGADGFLLCFDGEDGGVAQMRRFANEVRPRLGRARPGTAPPSGSGVGEHGVDVHRDREEL
jgi:hypothetical protein